MDSYVLPAERGAGGAAGAGQFVPQPKGIAEPPKPLDYSAEDLMVLRGVRDIPAVTQHNTGVMRDVGTPARIRLFEPFRTQRFEVVVEERTPSKIAEEALADPSKYPLIRISDDPKCSKGLCKCGNCSANYSGAGFKIVKNPGRQLTQPELAAIAQGEVPAGFETVLATDFGRLHAATYHDRRIGQEIIETLRPFRQQMLANARVKE